MGVWGAGLYSGDYAMDLRSSVGAVASLPFEPAELLAVLRRSESSAADNPADSEVVADQFHKRGIDCPEARQRALAIITDGEDLAAMARLGMGEKTLARRRAALEEIAARLRAPLEAKPRKVLKAPQPYVVELGEALAYPVNDKGAPINPYIVGKPWPIAMSWAKAAWGACVIVDIGRAFDILAWYRPLGVAQPFQPRPTLADLWTPRRWLMRNGGTLSARHLALMQMERLGHFDLDPARRDAAFPGRAPWNSAAINDISLANYLSVRDLDVHEEHRVKHGYPPTPVSKL